jgi:hypothetical protein
MPLLAAQPLSTTACTAAQTGALWQRAQVLEFCTHTNKQGEGSKQACKHVSKQVGNKQADKQANKQAGKQVAESAIPEFIALAVL